MNYSENKGNTLARSPCFLTSRGYCIYGIGSATVWTALIKDGILHLSHRFKASRWGIFMKKFMENINKFSAFGYSNYRYNKEIKKIMSFYFQQEG